MIAIADRVWIVGAVSEHSPGQHGALLAAKAAAVQLAACRLA